MEKTLYKPVLVGDYGILPYAWHWGGDSMQVEPELFKVTWTWAESPKGRQKPDLKRWGKMNCLGSWVKRREGRDGNTRFFKNETSWFQRGGRKVLVIGLSQGQKEQGNPPNSSEVACAGRLGSPCCGTSLKTCSIPDSLSWARAGDGRDNFQYSVVTFSSSFFPISSTTWLPSGF